MLCLVALTTAHIITKDEDRLKMTWEVSAYFCLFKIRENVQLITHSDYDTAREFGGNLRLIISM